MRYGDTRGLWPDATLRDFLRGRGDTEMVRTIALLIRVVVGVASIVVAWLVLDNIHDRNTEVIVACVGLLYCFIFVISRRWQYYGLSVFSLFGMTAARLAGEPYDQALRNEIGLTARTGYAIVTVAFAAAIELLCIFRLFTSLLGHGWDRLAAPVHAAVDWPQILEFLGMF
jgi:hypothetical protein